MQKAVALIDLAALAFLLVLLLLTSALGLSQDTLLFKSDSVSLTLFCLSLSLCAFVLVLPILALATLVVSDKTRLVKLLAVMLVAAIGTGFIVFGVETFFYSFERISTLVAVSLTSFVVCLGIVWRQAGRSELVGRAVMVGRTLSALAVVSFLGLTALRLVQKGTGATGRRNVVLVILDGWGPKYVYPYNPLIRDPAIQQIVEDSLVFTEARTNFAYTSGYFGALYSGTKSGPAQEGSLFGILQREGINTRWITNHNNGVPESGKGARAISDYRGLRSALITQHYSWVPAALGLDYNIFLHRKGGRGVPMGPRERAVYRFANDGAEERDLIREVLTEEIERLREDGRSFFLVFHSTSYGKRGAGRGLGEHAPWKAAEGAGEAAEVEKRIRKRQYAYEAEEAWLVDLWHQGFGRRCLATSKTLLGLFQHYKRKGWDQDTLLIITADHGKIFEKGRVWYGYHAEEEVARVPLIVHHGGRRGRDDRLCDTIDIPRTILDYYGIEGRLSESAISLLGEESKPLATTLTMTSSRRRERFLIIYTGEFKHTFNIYRPKKPTWESAVVEGFETTVQARNTWIDPELPPERFEAILRSYSPPKDEVNP